MARTIHHPRHAKRKKRANVRKSILSFAAVSLLSISGIATYANFTDTATTQITAQSGSINLTLNNSKTHSINLGNTLKPGDVKSFPITVRNTGTIPLNYRVTSANASGAYNALTTALKAEVTLANGATATTTNLNNINTGNRTIPANGSVTFNLKVTFPTSGISNFNDLQNRSGNTILTFHAVQS